MRLLARVVGIGIKAADMLVQEILSHPRPPGGGPLWCGAPDESGGRRREKGLATAGNARVRRGMLQLAWRFLMLQKDSAWPAGTGRGPPMPAAIPARL